MDTPTEMPVQAQAMENTSGMGAASVVPPEIMGWSWGAFLLNWIWGIFNGTFIALLMFIPFVNLVMWFVLGAKGREWAWRNKRWQSVEHFKHVQHQWGIAGVIVMIPAVLIGGLSILSAIVLVAVNPARQFALANNSARESNVMTILNAVEQYQVDHGAKLPADIPSTPTEICATDATSCNGLVDLHVLTDDTSYLGSVPVDPLCSTKCSVNGTGYTIKLTATGRIIVDAPNAEVGAAISASR